MYLTYEEYTNMGGTLGESTFNDFEFEAEASINWYTFSRLKKMTTYPEEVKRCVYSLIKLTALKADALSLGDAGEDTSPIVSQSNDGVLTSYNVMDAGRAYRLCSDEIGNTIKHYLNDVTNELGQKLLYRGLYQGE